MRTLVGDDCDLLRRRDVEALRHGVLRHVQFKHFDHLFDQGNQDKATAHLPRPSPANAASVAPSINLMTM